MAVVQDDPEAVAESIENECLGLNLLLFSHRNLHGVDLLLPGKLID